MKLAILNVCKAWHQVGTEPLYESVLFPSIGQLPAFVRDLEDRDGPGFLVRYLDISCMIPRGYCRLFESESEKLFRLCPRLMHFGFVPIYLIPLVPRSLPIMSASITSLEYSEVLPSLLQLSGTLRSDRYRISTISPCEHHLDIWYKWAGLRAVVDNADRTFGSAFPALLTCRRLDVSFSYLWDLPIRFPPDETNGENAHTKPKTVNNNKKLLSEEEQELAHDRGSSWLAAVLEFADLDSVNANALPIVDYDDDKYFVVDSSLGEESDPEDYLDSDSDVSSCITVDKFAEGEVAFLADELYIAEDNWEIDREQALEIFSRVHSSYAN
ncbi:hypothetical protein C8R43DRAFT_1136539 [Mycena crocata]|nr:hypothetical protein C8R43DRAFT_1136539 [Mycena crocata]